jgi:hypothetical protein
MLAVQRLERGRLDIVGPAFGHAVAYERKTCLGVVGGTTLCSLDMSSSRGSGFSGIGCLIVCLAFFV